MIDVSPFIESLKNKTLAVFGLGASGLSVIKACKKAGATVYAWDDKNESRLMAEKAGATLTELNADVLKKCDCLVLAPGVPLTHPAPHPVVNVAHEAGFEIIGDIEIFHRSVAEKDWKIIGLTGTNGKSTTTTLIHHILNETGGSVSLGGNIGLPVLEMKPPKKDGIVVLELSSSLEPV